MVAIKNPSPIHFLLQSTLLKKLIYPGCVFIVLNKIELMLYLFQLHFESLLSPPMFNQDVIWLVCWFFSYGFWEIYQKTADSRLWPKSTVYSIDHLCILILGSFKDLMFSIRRMYFIMALFGCIYLFFRN